MGTCVELGSVTARQRGLCLFCCAKPLCTVGQQEVICSVDQAGSHVGACCGCLGEGGCQVGCAVSLCALVLWVLNAIEAQELRL